MRVLLNLIIVFAVAFNCYAGQDAFSSFTNGYNFMRDNYRQDESLELQRQSIRLQNERAEMMRQQERREQERYDIEMKERQAEARRKEQSPVEQFYKEYPQYENNPKLRSSLLSTATELMKDRKYENKSRAEILIAAHSEITGQKNQQKEADTLWAKEQEMFFKIHPEYKQDQFLWDTLNGVVIRLANSPEYRNKSGIETLMAAHEEVFKRTGSEEKKKQRNEIEVSYTKDKMEFIKRYPQYNDPVLFDILNKKAVELMVKPEYSAKVSERRWSEILLSAHNEVSKANGNLK